MKLGHISVTALLGVVLSFLTALPAAATATDGETSTNELVDAVGLIVKYKPNVSEIAPNGQPTGENTAAVGLEDPKSIGLRYTAVEFEKDLSPQQAADALARIKLDPRVESAELDSYVSVASARALPIEPLIISKSDPIQLPIFIKTAIRKPTMRSVVARDAWVSGATPRVKISWSKPTTRYSGVIIGYRVQIHAAGAWRTIKSQTSSRTRSFTTTSAYLSAGTRTAFRVAAIFKYGRKTYVGNYKNSYVIPTTMPVANSSLAFQISGGELQANWSLLNSLIERGGLDVSYTTEVRRPDGSLVSCNPVSATRCLVSGVASGTVLSVRLIISNSRGSAVTESKTVSYTTSNPVSFASNPLFTYQWHLNTISATNAWNVESGLDSVVVAVLDSGITSNPDLDGKLVPGFNAITPGGSAEDLGGSPWHGTHVAGIIGAADNGLGVLGVAPNVRIEPVKVLEGNSGILRDLIAGINWARGVAISEIRNNYPAQVINISLAGPGACGGALNDAITAARGDGITVVAAAGNENANAVGVSPGNCESTLTVAATGPEGKPAYYSNFGTNVSISAPGGDPCQGTSGANQIYSTIKLGQVASPDSSWEYMSGTSMAAPVVAGVVALMYSAKMRQIPGFDPDYYFVDLVRQKLLSTVSPFSDSTPTLCTDPLLHGGTSIVNGFQNGGYGAGIVNAAAAVSAILQ